MALQFDATTRNDWATTLNTNIGAAANLEIYTGAAPASCATAASGTLLATCACNATAFGAVASGVLTANAISAGTAAAAGTAGYFRVLDSGGTCHAQGTVGVSASDLNITNTTIASGDTVTVTSLVLTAPGA